MFSKLDGLAAFGAGGPSVPRMAPPSAPPFQVDAKTGGPDLAKLPAQIPIIGRNSQVIGYVDRSRLQPSPLKPGSQSGQGSIGSLPTVTVTAPSSH